MNRLSFLRRCLGAVAGVAVAQIGHVFPEALPVPPPVREVDAISYTFRKMWVVNFAHPDAAKNLADAIAADERVRRDDLGRFEKRPEHGTWTRTVMVGLPA